MAMGPVGRVPSNFVGNLEWRQMYLLLCRLQLLSFVRWARHVTPARHLNFHQRSGSARAHGPTAEASGLKVREMDGETIV